jgi:hypothetical protein
MCTKCRIEKPLADFSGDKKSKKDGLNCWCRECVKPHSQQCYLNNREHHNLLNKQWCSDHPEKIKIIKQRWRQNHPEHIQQYNQRYRHDNKEQISRCTRNRKHNDVQFRIICNLRTRFYVALKHNFKSGSAVRDLGSSIEWLKGWLEMQWNDGMSWDNYGNGHGKWNIDHIIPLSSFDLTNRKEFLKACHWTNLQPLWWIDNVKKGDIHE